MKYSKILIDGIKKVYPDWKLAHELAENGGTKLGNYLESKSLSGISNKEILAAKSLEELQKKARQNEAGLKLYDQWSKEYEAEINMRYESKSLGKLQKKTIKQSETEQGK